MLLAERSYAATKAFPKDELYGMTAQIRRCSTSIAANIAEGYGRDSDGSFIQFLRISHGSLKELETHIILSERVGIMPPATAAEFLESTDEVGKMLRGLITAVSEKASQ
jgi:four helix bundle protein